AHPAAEGKTGQPDRLERPSAREGHPGLLGPAPATWRLCRTVGTHGQPPARVPIALPRRPPLPAAETGQPACLPGNTTPAVPHGPAASLLPPDLARGGPRFGSAGAEAPPSTPFRADDRREPQGRLPCRSYGPGRLEKPSNGRQVPPPRLE